MIRSEITPSEQNFGLDVIVNLVVKSEEPKEDYLEIEKHQHPASGVIGFKAFYIMPYN